ncbi:hypothetical protein FDF31_03955 [Clostridium sporogenes]|nr:hypothetical protein [Clostridium sporogenes]NFS24823.1 hypothetical protein [Clostridium sporogenes]
MKVESLKKGFYYKIILILGLVTSILWVILVDTKPFSDFKYYYDVAVDIANGLPWGDTYTSIGYSIVLGGIFKLFGASLINAKIFNLILTLISNVCFLSILDKLDINEKERKIIFSIFVFMPNNIFYNSILANEILFTTILLIITNIYFSKVKYKYAYIGALTGINTMIKPFFIVFAFAVFLVDLLKEKKISKSIQNSLIVLVTCILVISPWIYRNTKLVGQFTYISNNGGIVLYINNNSQNKLGRWMPAEDDILYGVNGSGLSYNMKLMLCIITNFIRAIIFIPAIIYIINYSKLILKSISSKKTDTLNKFNIYSVVLFFMFNTIYFVTEGQGRYAFPEIFIMIYCFSKFVKGIILKRKSYAYDKKSPKKSMV